MRLSSRAGGVVAVLAASVGLALPAFGTETSAAAPSEEPGAAYSGTASAEGVRLTYEVDGYLLTDRFVDGGAPVAQASVSSVESVGFASAPYPGDTVLTAPGLAGGAVGAPLPGYPLVASSQYPGREEETVDHGVVRMSASSTAASSSATSAAGGPSDEAASLGATRSAAEVVHDEANGTVTSISSTHAEAFTAAGVFRIGRVATDAKVVDAPNGEPQREFSFEVADVTIAGQTVALTESGLALPGSTTPLPDTSPLVAALRDQGIGVRYVAAEETPDGVIAPGVEVRVTHPLPGAPAPAVAVYRLGQASASATGGMGTLTVNPVAAPSIEVGGGDNVAGDAPPVAAAPAPPIGADATSAPRGGDVAAPVVDQPGHGDAHPIAEAVPQWAKTWTMAFYLVIVLSGLVAVSGGQLIRLLGVRMPWTS